MFKPNGKFKNCARDGCTISFIAQAPNQRFCSDECNLKNWASRAAEFRTEYMRGRTRDNKLYLIRYKGSFCQDCGGDFPPCCFDFDHRDPSAKKFDVCAKIGHALATLIPEVDKCDLVCANCHRLRTWRRYGCNQTRD